ncbi:hypothetical protein [Halalkalibacter alkaliphilus]|uniref:Uncharacterized protein n=1 Tax=Halalkalibacter alkaliphilus TaxID=2917993 RepID=A0A9X2I711_9BACI|nr:hypothetical protein [Halalkalibacter alkaliphilus]MCL7749212.1 hypothetical protein [Halalkalibacter alkaliphilus]
MGENATVKHSEENEETMNFERENKSNTHYKINGNKVVFDKSLIIEVDGQEYELFNVHRSLIRKMANKSLKRSIITSLLGDGAGLSLLGTTATASQFLQATMSAIFDRKFMKKGCQEVMEGIANLYGLNIKDLETKINALTAAGDNNYKMKSIAQDVKTSTQDVMKTRRGKLLANVIPFVGAVFTAYLVRDAVVEFGEKIMDQIEDKIEAQVRNGELEISKAMIKKYGGAPVKKKK